VNGKLFSENICFFVLHFSENKPKFNQAAMTRRKKNKGKQMENLRKKMVEALSAFRKLVALALIIAALIASHYLAYSQGQKDMHLALTSDMQRYGEAGIMARNPSGAFYLYTSTTKYCQWLEKRMTRK
jgi:hypothetical protein